MTFSLRQIVSVAVFLLAVCGGCSWRTGDNRTRSGDQKADEQRAVPLRGADAGNSFQQAYLGFMYFHGDGVPQDCVRSYMWLNIAAARATGESRSDIEQMRAIVVERLTPVQIADAQKRSSEWMDAFAKRQK